MPGKSKLHQIARQLKNQLLNDPKWRLDYNSMVEVPYGVTIDGVNNAKEILMDMGTGGTNLQLQSKQAITCALMKVDAHNNVRNRGL